MVEYILENEQFCVTVNRDGCELTGARRKADGREFIWCGAPDVWKRHAPVLFPMVGKYRDNTMRHEGQTYHMSQHGFARDRAFRLVSFAADQVVMKLTADDQSRENYPFDFELTCTYSLKENVLTAGWQVKNCGDGPMYFSLGGHPAFVGAKNTLADAQLKFADARELKYGLLSGDGLLEDALYDLKTDENGLTPLSADYFDRDALIFEKDQSHCISLVEDGKPFVTVKFDAPVFGIWSAAKKNVPFVCIEPWYGRTDRVNFAGELKDREWGNTLAPGEVFNASYEMIFG